MSLIDPRIDVYGSHGRTCALADLLEVRAIHKSPMSRQDLADLIVDMNWRRKRDAPLILRDDDEDYDAGSLDEETFALVEERSRILRDQYPFMIKLGQLVVKPNVQVEDEAYTALLAIAIAHGWRITCGERPPENTFELIVVEALQTKLSTVGLGTASRSGTGFVDSLIRGAEELGLTASPNPTPRSTSAKDAGVDTIAGIIWPDGRPGHWILVGQVTCGKTDIWRSKLVEPKPPIWRGYLQEPLTPGRFLAVPHHVDPRFLTTLHQNDEGLVLDRLRLVLCLTKFPNDARSVVDALLGASID